MTKDEAIQAMREGKKVTHKYFTPDEWVTMEGDEILLEYGVRCDEYEFWKWRTSPIYETGWSLYVA